jgi:cellulose 1,4-beta-cellobiosidase
VDCAEVCHIEGARYQETYGVTTSGDELKLKFVTKHQYGTNVGSRMYLMENTDTYQMFDLLGNEFTFDVDLSTVACGMNSALYFVPMEADGGVSQFSSNEAGAKYGTGYCDSQCARDLKFVGDTVSTIGRRLIGVGKTDKHSVFRVTRRAGCLLSQTTALVSVSSVLAVVRSTSGSPMPTPLL